MGRYRFAAHDLRTKTYLGDVPFVGTFSERLNQSGPLVGSINLNAFGSEPSYVDPTPGADPICMPGVAQGYIDATTPRRSVLWIERDKVVIDAHIIWGRQTQQGSTAMILRGSSLFRYFEARRLRQTTSYTNVDQLAIAKDLIDRAQAVSGGDIGVITEVNASGRLRTRDPISWDYEAKIVGQLIKNLANTIDGFDFSIDPARDTNGEPIATFRTHYPRRGRTAAASGVRFTLGGNLLDVEVSEEEDNRPNTVLAIGAGGGVQQLEDPAVDGSEIDAGWPLLEWLYVRKDVSNAETLGDNARGELVMRQDSTRYTLLVDPDHKVSPLGSYVVGDDARVIIPAGMHFRFPSGFDGVLRIVEREITIRDTGAEEVRLKMGAPRG